MLIVLGKGSCTRLQVVGDWEKLMSLVVKLGVFFEGVHMKEKSWELVSMKKEGN